MKKLSQVISIAFCFLCIVATAFFITNIHMAKAEAIAITAFTATPKAVESGKAVLLGWTTNTPGAICSIAGTGTVGVLNIISNYFMVYPTRNTEYTLVCKPGAAYPGVSRKVSVTIISPPVKITSFTATPPSIIRGNSATLKWATANAVKCFSIKNLPTDILFGSGTNTTARSIDLNNSTGISISPTTSSRYVMVCGDSSLNPVAGFTLNSTNTMTTLTVTVSPPPAPRITSFIATPASVITSGFTKLTWTSLNATTCTLQGTSVATSSPVVGTSVGPIDTSTNYTLFCTGAGGTANQVRTVAVTPAPTTVCKYINLTLNESKPATPANSPVSITLIDKNATGEEIGSSVFPYSAEWSPDYVLKTLRANGTVIGSYNLFSGRFINLENFTTPSLSQMIEVPQATLNAVVPFSSEIRSIQIDSKPTIPLNASTMSCSQVCRINGQSVTFPEQKCCTGLSVKSINNSFVCNI